MLPGPKADNSIPLDLSISLPRFEEIYPLWARWRALDKQFLPTEIQKQPEHLLDDIIYLDMLLEKMVRQQIEREHGIDANG